jgi:hypothetical protein
MLIRKTHAVEEPKWPLWLYDQYNQSINVTDGMSVMSLPASLLEKVGVTMDCLWQMCYTENYHVKSKSGVTFSVALKQDHSKINHIKCDLSVFQFREYIFSMCVSHNLLYYISLDTHLLKIQILYWIKYNHIKKLFKENVKPTLKFSCCKVISILM